MTTPTAAATYTWVTYSNAYNTVIRPLDSAPLPEPAPARLHPLHVASWLLRKWRDALAQSRQAAQRRAALKRAGDDAMAVTRLARSLERDYPSMAAELQAAVARHAGQFD